MDISADHMVCDLTTLDSMTQRLGRVNRRGGGAAEVDVVYESDPDQKKKDNGFEMARWKTLEIFKRLPKCEWEGGGDRQEASPLELRNLNLRDDDRKAAFAPEPVILPATDILFDSWALTTIRDKLPGRPPVEPYLHGVSDWQPPETDVAWREEIEVITDNLFNLYTPEDLLDDYPLTRDLPLVVGDRGSTITDRSFRTVSGDEQAMARQLKHVVIAQAFDGGNVDRLPAFFVNDVNHATEWLPHGLLGPPRQSFSDRVQEGHPPFAVSGDYRIANA